MRTILLSFDSDSYKQVESGKTIFEYRNMLPKYSTLVFFYVTRPIKAITGVAKLGNRESLLSWKSQFLNRPKNVLKWIDENMGDCKYVSPILEFQKTNYLSLSQIHSVVPNFVIPRMYYFIDNTPLLSYLNENLYPVGDIIINNFDQIPNDKICI